jgi:formyltetrahydrofolate-dependent phosphoribosylglycinamide formyltransferase
MISGGGRSLQNLIDLINNGSLEAEIAVVIASRGQVKGVDRARDAGIPVEIVRKREYPDVGSFSQRITAMLEAYRVKLAVQAGWMCYWEIPPEWTNRVMNIHPALLPKFGGQGFHGDRVHEAVLAAGETESGCTVHFANNEYDAGPIILQRTIPVLPDDTVETLATRVFEQERIAYPVAIRLFAEGRLDVQGDHVEIIV